MKRERSQESGQTLLELVVAIGVVAIVITALVAAVTASLRYSQATRLRSRGVKYAQEGLELARKLRDISTWDVFQTYANGAGNWCLDESGVWTIDASGGECPLSASNNFWRAIHFAWTDPTMDVTVTVNWGERNVPSTVVLKTYFTHWK